MYEIPIVLKILRLRNVTPKEFACGGEGMVTHIIYKYLINRINIFAINYNMAGSRALLHSCLARLSSRFPA